MPRYGEKYLGSVCKRNHGGMRYVSNRECVECVAKRTADLRANPETYKLLLKRLRDRYSTPLGKARQRSRDLKRKYGLLEADYNRMVRAQKSLCRICQTKPDGKRLHVDHNHDTGVVRGLLCEKCNWGLGSFNDDPKLLSRAEAYLRSPPPSLKGEPTT